MIKVLEIENGWEMLLDGERICSCVGSLSVALSAFAANWPEHAEELDGLADLLCEPVSSRQDARRAASGAKRAGGSGRRFRELIEQGKSNAECLAVVRAEFPDSRATLSDAAWNRARVAKEKGQAL